MRYRLFATDLDGTLLTEDNEIRDDVRDRMKELFDQGVAIVLATGRMTNTVRQYLDRLWDGVIILSYNGARVVMPDGSERHNYVGEKQIRQIARYCKEHDLYMQTYSPGTIYAKEYCDELKRDPDLVYSKFVQVDDFEKYQYGASPKVLCVRWKDDIDDLMEEMRGLFPNLFITKSNADLIEITAKGVDKATALSGICDTLGVKREETVAIGDSMNDQPMVSWAGMGVAVANADPRLKAEAKMVTEAERTDGVLEALNKLF